MSYTSHTSTHDIHHVTEPYDISYQDMVNYVMTDMQPKIYKLIEVNNKLIHENRRLREELSSIRDV